MINMQSRAIHRAFITLITGVIFSLCFVWTGAGQTTTRKSPHAGAIAAGTTIKVRTNEAINTSTEGQRFSGVMDL